MSNGAVQVKTVDNHIGKCFFIKIDFGSGSVYLTISPGLPTQLARRLVPLVRTQF